jgi:hypothetical protein
MEVNFLKLYKDLADEISLILRGEGPEIEKFESCFRCGIRYWENLKEKIKKNYFKNDEEEIHFFKYVKPKFTGLIEYYTQRYQAFLFLPDKDTASKLYFWNMELKKIDRFYDSQQAFIRYYQSGDKDLDELYFLRAESDCSNFQYARVYDLDSETATSHDWLVSRMVAFELYRSYIKEELEKVKRAQRNFKD